MSSPELAPLLTKSGLSARAEAPGGWTDRGYVGGPRSDEGRALERGFGAKAYVLPYAKLSGGTGVFLTGELHSLPIISFEVASDTVRAYQITMPPRLASDVPTLASESYRAVSDLTVDMFANQPWWQPSKAFARGWAKVDANLAQFSKYGQGWDGDDADPIPRETIRAATEVARGLRNLHAPPPSTAAVYDDGEIELQWRSDGGFAALSIDRLQRLTAFVRARLGQGSFKLENERANEVCLTSFIRALNAM